MLRLIISTGLFVTALGECFHLVNDPGFQSYQWESDVVSDLWDQHEVTSPYPGSVFLASNESWWGYQPIHTLRRILYIPSRVSELDLNLTVQTNQPDLLSAEIYTLSDLSTMELDLTGTSFDWTSLQVRLPVHEQTQIELFFRVTVPNDNQVWLALSNLQVQVCPETDSVPTILGFVLAVNLIWVILMIIVPIRFCYWQYRYVIPSKKTPEDLPIESTPTESESE